MIEIPNEPADNEIPVDERLAARKRAALEIDPLTAKVMWTYGYESDPYDVHRDLADEEKCVGRVYFARKPGSDIWVAYRDLPKETLRILRDSGRERRALEELAAEIPW